MTKYLIAFIMVFSMCGCNTDPGTPPVHLYVLAGQSNMVNMPIEHFSTHMPSDAIIIKYAVSGTSISRWNDELYQGILDRLPAHYDDMTLVWMQGERDSNIQTPPEVYKELFMEFFGKIGADYLVIGRVNTYYGLDNPIRQAQVELAFEFDGEWVNTDDLGTGLHFDDYETLGQRFAGVCLLINAPN